MRNRESGTVVQRDFLSKLVLLKSSLCNLPEVTEGSCRFLTMFKGMLFRQRLLRLLFWQYKWSTNLLAARTVPLPEQAAASSYLLILGELKGEG